MDTFKGKMQIPVQVQAHAVMNKVAPGGWPQKQDGEGTHVLSAEGLRLDVINAPSPA